LRPSYLQLNCGRVVHYSDTQTNNVCIKLQSVHSDLSYAFGMDSCSHRVLNWHYRTSCIRELYTSNLGQWSKGTCSCKVIVPVVSLQESRVKLEHEGQGDNNPSREESSGTYLPASQLCPILIYTSSRFPV
jgi:hypothetical protein